MWCYAWQSWNFGKEYFCSQNGENGPKQGFLNLLENLFIIFFWIWSIKKVYINCCILAQILYLGKIWFGNALRQSNCRIFKLNISLKQNDEKAWFFACWYRYMEIKNWLRNIRVGVVKNGCVHSGPRTLKLALSQEGVNRINWSLVCS